MNWHICHKRKLLFFCSYFQHISLCFYLDFKRESSLDAKFNFASKEYPNYILLTDPATPKTRNTWKMWWHHHIFRYFLFLGQQGPSKVCRVGTRWMQNLIPHPTSSPDWDLSKNTGRYVENTNKKNSFSSSKINKYYFIILLILFWRPILSWNFL